MFKRSWIAATVAFVFTVLLAGLAFATPGAPPSVTQERPASPAAASPPVFGSQTNLSQTPANSGYPKVAASGKHVYTVWADRGIGQDLEIHFRHSENGGAVFSGRQNLSNSPSLDSNYPMIAASGSNVYVVWEEHKPPFGAREIMLAISPNNGHSFGAPFAISNTAGDSTHPLIAVSEPYVWVIWDELDGERNGLNLARSSDGGTTFHTQRLGQGAVSWSTDIAAAGEYVYVITNYKDVTSGTYSVRLWAGHYSAPNTFDTNQHDLMSSVSHWTDPVVAAAGDNAYAFWRVHKYTSPGNLEEKFYYARSTSKGSSFSTPSDFTVGSPTGIRSGYMTPIAIAASGDNVYVAWVEVNDPYAGPRTGKMYVSSSSNRGLNFLYRELDALSGTREEIAGLTLDATGIYVHAAWYHVEDAPSNVEVYAAASLDNGVTFSPKANVSANPAESGAPSVASGGADFHVAWMDSTPGNWDVLYRQGTIAASDIEVGGVTLVQAVPTDRDTIAGKPSKVQVEVTSHYATAQTTQATLVWDDSTGHHSSVEDVSLVPGRSLYYFPQLPVHGVPYLRPVTGTLAFTVTLAPLVGEIDTANNSQSRNVSAAQARPLRIVYRPLATPFEAYPLCAELTKFANTSSRLIEAVLPIDDRQVHTQIDCIPLIVPTDVTEAYTYSDGTTELTIKDSVFEALTLGDWIGGADRVVGVTRPNWLIDRIGGTVGLAPLPGTSVIVDSAMTSGAISVHELAHNYGWVWRGYPKANGAHLDNWPAEGYWVVRGQPMTGRIDFMNSSAVDPSGAAVTQRTWISPETFTNLVRHAPSSPTSFSAASLPLSSDPGSGVIGVRGVITRTGGVTFAPWYRMEGDLDLPLDNPGDYRLRYTNAGDNLLGETGFDLSFEPPPDAGTGQTDSARFAYRIPDITGTHKIALLHDGTTLAERIVSSNPPTVTVTYPNGGETLLTGEVITATWSASDPDGDSLSYITSLSADGGTTWRAVTGELTQTEASFEVPQNILSDQMLLKVMASDGINTASDSSDAAFSFRRNTATAGCFGTPTNMTNSDGVDSYEQMIASAGTHAYMVWSEHQDDGARLYFRASADSGQTWTDSEELSNSGYSTGLWPQVAAVGSDVYVTWGTPGSGWSKNTNFIVSHDYGQTFSSPATLFTNAGMPQLIVDGDRLYVRTGTSNTVLLKVSTDGGDSFTSLPAIALNPVGWIESTALAILGDNIYLAYSDDSDMLKFRRSTNGGASFSSPVTLVYEQYAGYDITLVAQGSSVYLAWYQDSLLSGQPGYMRFAVSTDRGATFGTPLELDFEPAARIMSEPQLRVAGSTIHMLWNRPDSTTSENTNVYYAVSEDGGASFGTPTNLSQTDQKAYQETMTVFDDKVYVAWQEDLLEWDGYGTLGKGETKVRASADGGESFGAIRNISNSPTLHSDWPGLAVVNDTVLLHWREAGTYDVLLTRSEECAGGGDQISLTPMPPVLPAIDSPTVLEGTNTVITITATDDNYDAIAYSAQNLPSFAAFEDQGDGTATLTVAPGFGQAGVYSPTTVIASDGVLTTTQSFNITVGSTNQPPFARPGGPYAVYEGSSLHLEGSGSSDPEGQVITYTWQFRGQTYSEAGVDVPATDDYTGQAVLEVRDVAGAVQTATAEVAILNSPPTVVAAPNGSRLATFADSGTADAHTATIDWGDGTSPVDGVVAETGGSGSVSGSHTYAVPGTYTVTVTVRDDDGGEGSVDFPMEGGQWLLYLPLVQKQGP